MGRLGAAGQSYLSKHYQNPEGREKRKTQPTQFTSHLGGNSLQGFPLTASRMGRLWLLYCSKSAMHRLPGPPINRMPSLSQLPHPADREGLPGPSGVCQGPALGTHSLGWLTSGQLL